MEKYTFTITENGFSMKGDNKVCIPACKITACSFLEANDILQEFLKTKVKPECMQLITPIERIDFD